MTTRFLSVSPSAFLLSSRFAYVLLFLLITAYVIGYTWMSWHLHATFITSADDLSNVDQVVWNSQQGRILERTTGTRSLPRYGEHVEPIWIALGLLYVGWDDVRALLLTQTIFLALGAVPVFWFARDAWRREHPAYGAGVVFATVYLLNPFVTRANIAEVHATPFVVAPMLLALYWGWKGKWARVIPLAILVLLVREDTGLLLMGFGAWVLLGWLFGRLQKAESRKRGTATSPPDPLSDTERGGTEKPPFVSSPVPLGRGTTTDLHREAREKGERPSAISPFKAAAALAASGIAGVLITVFGIIRTFADERFSGSDNSIFFGRYALFGDSPLAIIGGMLTRWDVWAELFRDPYRLHFLRDFVLATGGLGLFAPAAWVLFAPHFILNLFSDYFGQYGSLQHYGAPLVPGMMVAAILGGATLLKWGRYHPAWRVTLLVVALGGALFTARTATGQPLAVDWITPAETEHHRLLDVLIQQIPPDAPLSADPQLHPHLAHRRDAYRFPTVGDNAGWILVDVTTNTTRHPVDLKQDIEELLAGEWGIADARDGYLLLQKGNPTKTIPTEFYTFTTAATPPAIPIDMRLSDHLTIVGYTLHQDFWGRVSIEWVIRPRIPVSNALQLDAALLALDGGHLPDTTNQPIPALIWQPMTEWQPDQDYAVRTLPRHASSPFHPALSVRDGEHILMPNWFDNGVPLSPTIPLYIRDQSNGWLLGGEWTLTNNHVRRGNEGWRQFDPPADLAMQKAVWQVAELRAWDIEQTNSDVRITLTWYALPAFRRPVYRFVHLVPREGAPIPITQSDDILGGHTHPVERWREGEWVQETIILPRPPADTEWRILVGLYEPASGSRLPVTPDAGDHTFELE